ncbi:transposase, partial [Escherichia coli]
ADRNRSHWSTSKTPSYTKSVSWQHHPTALILSSVCDMPV